MPEGGRIQHIPSVDRKRTQPTSRSLAGQQHQQQAVIISGLFLSFPSESARSLVCLKAETRELPSRSQFFVLLSHHD